MNSKHRKTLNAIFENPIRANIFWRDIESMLISLGAAGRDTVKRDCGGLSPSASAERNR